MRVNEGAVRLSDFDFELPDEAIARHPVAERDRSRLMVLDRATGAIEDRSFAELPSLLDPKDLLVFNDSKVFPARLRAKKAETGGRVEILLVEEVGAHWRAMVNASKPVRAGASLVLEARPVSINVVAEEGNGFVVLDFGAQDARALAHEVGELPLPPYLGRAAEESDRASYQTVFARHEGSVAAPTAGLHFTPRLLEALAARGIERAPITLHVGPGTFLPVRTEEIEKHEMLPERFEIPASTVEAISAARARKGRVVAVGTTVTRVLETSAAAGVTSGATNLFIKPGHQFRAVDALLTNFHLPRSTLIMLVAAFAGRETILTAYRRAVAEKYRFFSYGDAMLIR